MKSVRPLFQSKTTKVELEGIEFQLKRIADALESLLNINKPELVPGRDFDPDDFCEVTYSDEEKELVDQHLNKRIGGVEVDGPGLY